MPRGDQSSQDHYELLGVDADAGHEEISRAYRRQARDSHPDTHPGDPSAEERFKRVREAHAVLSDPARRRQYDRDRRRGQAEPGHGPRVRFGRDGVQRQPSRWPAAGFGSDRGAWGFRRGRDRAATIALSPWELRYGVRLTLDLVDGGIVEVRLPGGLRPGTTLLVERAGEPGMGGGPSGDLLLRVQTARLEPLWWW